MFPDAPTPQGAPAVRWTTTLAGAAMERCTIAVAAKLATRQAPAQPAA